MYKQLPPQTRLLAFKKGYSTMSFPPSLGITSAFIIDLDFQAESPPLLMPSLDCLHSQFSRSKMNGYSRIKKISTRKSKSVDFADLSFPAHNTTPRSRAAKNFKSPSHIARKSPAMHCDSIPENGEEDGTGEVFGIILSRKFPVSSSSSRSHKVITEQDESSSFHDAVRKSLSIKRSASVSEGYSRIHHQCDLITEDDGHHEAESISKKTNMKKKGKFFKACRRLFGF